MARINAWWRSAGVWFNAVLLIAVQYTDQIMQAMNDYLPSFAPYLPPNIYKAVGIAVVAFNLVRTAQRAHQATLAKEVGHG
jgi:hypothetical protein